MIHEFKSSAAYIKKRVLEYPKKGHGQYRKIAEFLGVHTTVLSQILRGDRTLTMENALDVCRYFGLTDEETRYFLALVQLERAATPALRTFFEKELNELRSKARDLKSRVRADVELSETTKAIYYSDWLYPAVRALIATGKFNTRGTLIERMGIDPEHVSGAIEFLVACGLCIEEKGKLKIGPAFTHLSADSPHIHPHRRNWRLQAIERTRRLDKIDLSYSACASISEADRERVREVLASTIAKLGHMVGESTPEDAVFLNIDWIRI